MPWVSFLRENAAFLFAGFLFAFTSSYGQTYFISLFAGEIRGEFGLTDGQWGGIYTLGTTLSAIAMIGAGAFGRINGIFGGAGDLARHIRRPFGRDCLARLVGLGGRSGPDHNPCSTATFAA